MRQTNHERLRLWGLTGLAVLGLVLSAYLAWLHREVHTNPVTQSWCSLNAAVDCAVVELSGRAVFLWLPRAAWGVLGYAALLAMMLPRLTGRGRALRTPVFVLCCAMVGAAVQSLVTSLSVVGSLCVVCLGTYAVSLACFAVALGDVRRDGPMNATLRRDIGEGLRRPIRVSIALGSALLIATAANLAYPKYWAFTLPRPYGPGNLPTGLDEQGLPWIGARSPRLTIVELSDYECPACVRSHAAVRAAVSQWPQDIRLVHRSFPLDMACNRLLEAPYHENACVAAQVACCAAEQDRFWLMSDLLFASWARLDKQRIDQLVERAGLDADALEHCLSSRTCQEAVAADVEAGIALHLDSTPAYLVNGTLLRGQLDATRIAQLLQEASLR